MSGRQQIRLGLAAAEQQADNANNGLTAEQRAALTRSVDSYSEENVANGVTVGVGTLRDGEAASTNFERDSAGRPTALGVDDNGVKFARVRVTFRNADIDERTVLHEGSHVADRQEFITDWARQEPALTEPQVNILASNLTKYQTELKAYMVTSTVDQVTNHRGEFWNAGWSEAQKTTAINNVLRTNALYGVTPREQGERMLVFPQRQR